MKCKYCKSKIDITELIFYLGKCYYCHSAKREVQYNKEKQLAEKEDREEEKKINERKKYFVIKKQSGATLKPS